MPFIFILETQYFVDDGQNRACQGGYKIMTSHACRTACNELDRRIGNIKNMKDGNECYIAGNGKCRQNGNRGKNTLLVCMKKGNRNILQHVKVQTTL